jgi:hypothetical protein
MQAKTSPVTYRLSNHPLSHTDCHTLTSQAPSAKEWKECSAPANWRQSAVGDTLQWALGVTEAVRAWEARVDVLEYEYEAISALLLVLVTKVGRGQVWSRMGKRIAHRHREMTRSTQHSVLVSLCDMYWGVDVLEYEYEVISTLLLVLVTKVRRWDLQREIWVQMRRGFDKPASIWDIYETHHTTPVFLSTYVG